MLKYYPNQTKKIICHREHEENNPVNSYIENSVFCVVIFHYEMFPARLKDIFSILLDNALYYHHPKFTPPIKPILFVFMLVNVLVRLTVGTPPSARIVPYKNYSLE